MWGWWLDSGHEDGLFQGKHGTGHRVKYKVDYFLDNFFWTIFFWTILKGRGSTPLVLREGWEVECYYSWRSGRFHSIVQTILIGFSTDLLYVKILALGQ